ncbi:MAG: hypothetical protein A2Y82_04990 [Candidatus Buchananbacteria bacterium RBG_13_36_9]|uniref:DUF3324 domain-containing protein n=1 Tax=Candidatus Buchananbacteria bacterium RBG_13_36_9 TaxID=1797530 RepID=A0A1G1XRS9_9BACT|nr:MAG: hypothetical protein A2Y82_04990 [Candidatus Buchananbacteria bacterium RBG_13_36_9]
MKTKICLLGIALLVGVLLLPLASSAITVSPPIIELEAAKGDVINQSIKVRNESANSETYYLSAERFVAGGEAGAPVFTGEDIDLATWIKFPYENVTIPGGQTIEIPFSIIVPNYAGPGGHYAAIFLSTAPPEAATTGGSNVAIASRIGTLVLVKIAGEVKEIAEISEFGTTAKTFDSLPVAFNIRVKNDGNVHLKPMGTISIKNMWGSVAGQVAVNETGGNVLPDQIRKFEASWVKNPNAVGANTFWGKYRQQKENYAFGKYEADLGLAYGTAGKILSAKTSFWVIPWNVIMVNLALVVIIVVIIYFAVKKYNVWLVKKYARKAKK